MAVKPPQPEPVPRRVDKPTPRKPGHVLDTPGEQHEEQVADPERGAGRVAAQEQDVLERDRDGRPRKVQRQQDQQGRGGRQQQQQQEPEEPKVTAGKLAFDDNFQKKQHAPRSDGPTVDDIVESLDEPSSGESLEDMLPRRRHPDLGPAEMEPPIFLRPLEAMRDIYMRVKSRMSRRTREILEGPDLEDLIGMMHQLFDDEALVRKSEARHRKDLLDLIGKDGPLLTGFSDPRLTEMWRLFLDGWDIWVPEGKETGVDLFWEGEGEDDDGSVFVILQSLVFREGEAILSTEIGALKEVITFDGQAFYRLKTDL